MICHMTAEFGQWVRAVRESEGLTQGDLAHQMNVDQTTVSRIEKGAHDASERFCVALARALDLPIPDVLRRAGYVAEGDLGSVEDDAIADFRLRLARVKDPAERERALGAVRDILDGAARRSRAQTAAHH